MSEEMHVSAPTLKALSDHEVRKRTKVFLVPKDMRTQDGLNGLMSRAFPIEPGFIRMETQIELISFCQYRISVCDEHSRKGNDIPPSNSGSLG